MIGVDYMFKLSMPCPICNFADELMVKFDGMGMYVLCGHCFSHWQTHTRNRREEQEKALEQLFTNLEKDRKEYMDDLYNYVYGEDYDKY